MIASAPNTKKAMTATGDKTLAIRDNSVETGPGSLVGRPGRRDTGGASATAALVPVRAVSQTKVVAVVSDNEVNAMSNPQIKPADSAARVVSSLRANQRLRPRRIFSASISVSGSSR